MRRFGFLAVLLSGFACGGEAVPEVPRDAGTAGPGVAADTVTVALPVAVEAQLYVEHDAPVLARARGIIESVHVDLGHRVRTGQLLATLENVDQEIALARAREDAANAERLLARLRSLAESGYAAVADSEQARYEAARAALALRQARRDYDLTRVTAPFDGVVTSRLARPQRIVAEGDSLFRVTALSPLLASVRVPQGAAATVSIGATVEVETPGGGATTGRVLRASPVLDAASGTREVIVAVRSAPGLQPGTAVTVRLGAEPRRVVAVAREAVRDDSYVMVLEDGRPVMRRVRLGAPLPDGRVEVASGLEPGERLVVVGAP